MSSSGCLPVSSSSPSSRWRSSCCSGTAPRAPRSPSATVRPATAAPRAARALRADPGLRQPRLRGVRQVRQGRLRRPRDHDRPHDLQCPAPCLGTPTAPSVPVWNEMKKRLPATFSVAIGGAFLYLLFGVPIGVAAARRRGTVGRQGPGLELPGPQLDPVLPVRPADLALPHGHLRDAVLQRHGYFPITENPAKWFCGHVPAPGWRSASSAARSTPGTPAVRWSRRSSEDYIRTAKAKGLPRAHGRLPARPARRAGAGRHDLRHRLRHPARPARSSPSGSSSIHGIGYWSLQARRRQRPARRRRHGALRRRRADHGQPGRRHRLQLPRPEGEAFVTDDQRPPRRQAAPADPDEPVSSSSRT